nr:NAD(P)-dependent oxidoreductase [Paenibacillus sp. MMS18-CY102]
MSAEEQARLEAAFFVDYIDIHSVPEGQLASYQAFLIHSRILTKQLERFTQCRYIGVRAHNTDYVNGELARQLGIAVRGIPQEGANAVAEHAFALLFAVTKQLSAASHNVQAGKWREGLVPNLELRGKTLGIIGYGTIGQEVAAIGAALGMKPLIASGRGGAATSLDGRLSVEDVLRQADMVTLHASTQAGGAPLIGSRELAMMKDGAILINTARGSLVHEKELAEALRSGKLYGAGLDVYEDEPVRDSLLCELPNVVCTPHVAYFTRETIARMNGNLIDRAIAFFEQNFK